MAMRTAVSTLLREEALDLCRDVERDCKAGNTYACGLLAAAKAIARKSVTVDEGMRVIQSMTIDPYSDAAQEKVGLLYDRGALRGSDAIVSIRPA